MSWKIEDLEQSLLIGSTLVEGSTLNESEATDILAGRTVLGHPTHEARELLNYRSAVIWLMKQFQASDYLSLNVVLDFHKLLFDSMGLDAGRWKSNRNYTYRSDGTLHHYLAPELVHGAMLEWVAQFNQDPSQHQVADAANLYACFQNIHPFEDGNGRIGRVLLAYWLHWRLNKSWHFYAADKISHLEALEASNQGNLLPLIQFIQNRLTDT